MTEEKTDLLVFYDISKERAAARCLTSIMISAWGIYKNSRFSDMQLNGNGASVKTEK